METQKSSPFTPSGRWQPSPQHAPAVISIIALALITVWVSGMGQNSAAAAMMMVDPRAFAWSAFETFEGRLEALLATLASGQVWRLVTPDFLHFSWAHLIFNSVMMWFLGSQVEWMDGRGRLLVLFLVTSLFSNILQYLVSGPLFGGLSGVVYGLLAYCWLSQQRRARFQFPPALVTFALLWLVIGYTPLPEMIGVGRMANEAHLGGFLAGLLCAAVLPLRGRRSQ